MQAEHCGTPETILQLVHPDIRLIHVWQVGPNKIYPTKVLHVHCPLTNWKLGSQTKQFEKVEHVVQETGQGLHV